MKPEATSHANRVCNAKLAAIPSPATQTTEMPSFDGRLPEADPLPAKLPPLFRVESLCRLPIDGRRHVARAQLFHAQAALSVFWVGGRDDVGVATDSLVAIRWLGDPFCCDGALRIARLVEASEPAPAFNLFDTVPHSWSTDRALLKDAAARWLQASRRARQSFNSRHWEADSFRSYLAAYGALSSNQ